MKMIDYATDKIPPEAEIGLYQSLVHMARGNLEAAANDLKGVADIIEKYNE